ncbi:MAG TPA: DUF4012 domain-containing protein [Patescibacteria group bacterium]
MKIGLPTALVNGAEQFAAKKLIEEILKKDINVVAVGGTMGWGTEGDDRLKTIYDINEIEERLDYVFDFEADETAWNKAEENEAKLTVISVNTGEQLGEIIERLNKRNSNWRLVAAEGVYGPGMGEETFLARAIRLAVENKNLILPSTSVTFRILAVDDLVEAVMRASFLSGTERERFLIVGKETNSEEVAKVLIDQAKMTRFKVIQSEMRIPVWNDEIVESNWKRLRWEPKVEFNKGIKETLQYFFSVIDEENRKKINGKNTEPKNKIIEEKQETNFRSEEGKERRVMEVVVEEETKAEEPKTKGIEEIVVVKEEKPVEIPVEIPKATKITDEDDDADEEIIEEEDDSEEADEVVVGRQMPSIDEIRPIILKNSNSRPVGGEEMEKPEVKIKMPVVEVKTAPIIPEKAVTRSRLKKTTKKQYKWLAWSAAGLATGIILCGPAAIGWKSYRIVKNLESYPKLLSQKKYPEAELLSSQTGEQIKSINTFIDEWGLNSIGLIRDYQNGLKIAEDAAQLEVEAVPLAKSSDAIYAAIFKDKEIDWNAETKNLTNKLDLIDRDLGNLQGRLSGDTSWIPPRWKGLVISTNDSINDYKRVIEAGREITTILPKLTGADGTKKDYMVLFQNESELRATGGFIGSYGIMSFDKGKFIDLEVHDIYEADGQLKGHVEPPAAIANYLNQPAWFMRDANWQPNFSASAKDIQWFLEKETGRSVDGVIGIDLAVAKAALGVIGEVKVPDFKEKVNKDNLYQQAEFYAETKSFPGSNQKASFLGGLSKQLFEEIKNLDSQKQLLMLKAMVGILDSNDIQIALNDKDNDQVMTDLGWDGNMYQGKCSTDRCFADYLYIVESNLGVNKANYFLLRNIEQTVEIGSQNIARVIKINYENTAKNANWPGGDYKNYMRVYLPKSINLASVSVIDGDDPNNRRIYNSGELQITDIGDKKEVAFLMTVPVMKKRIIEIRYNNSVNLEGTDKFSYLNYIQRQSGFGDTGIVTLVSFPDNWQPIQVQPSASVVGGKILFNQKLDKDIKMGVEIGK